MLSFRIGAAAVNADAAAVLDPIAVKETVCYGDRQVSTGSNNTVAGCRDDWIIIWSKMHRVKVAFTSALTAPPSRHLLPVNVHLSITCCTGSVADSNSTSDPTGVFFDFVSGKDAVLYGC